MFNDLEIALQQQTKQLAEEFGERELEYEKFAVGDIPELLAIQSWSLSAYDHENFRDVELTYSEFTGIENGLLVNGSAAAITFTDSVSGTVSISIDTINEQMIFEFPEAGTTSVVSGSATYAGMYAAGLEAIKRSIVN